MPYSGAFVYADRPVHLRALKWYGPGVPPAWEDASGEVLDWNLAAGWNRVRVVNDPATGDTRFVADGHAGIAWALVHQWCAGLPVGYF